MKNYVIFLVAIIFHIIILVNNSYASYAINYDGVILSNGFTNYSANVSSIFKNYRGAVYYTDTITIHRNAVINNGEWLYNGTFREETTGFDSYNNTPVDNVTESSDGWQPFPGAIYYYGPYAFFFGTSSGNSIYSTYDWTATSSYSQTAKTSLSFLLTCNGNMEAKPKTLNLVTYQSPLDCYSHFIQINNTNLISYCLQKNYWSIPISENKCGDTVTLNFTDNTNNGLSILGLFEASATYTYCDATITNLSGSNRMIDSNAGGDVTISAAVSESASWTLDIAGKTYTGSGPVSVTWDGKDASGRVVEPGGYSATLTAQTADGQCSDSKTINFTVEPPPDNSCSLYVDFGSTANVASGNLFHSQELFSTKGSGLTTAMTLYYYSQDPHSASLGTGWSHSYDISLKQNADGSIVLHEGNGKRKLYTFANGVYTSLPGDYNTLVKNADGTYTITRKDGTKSNFASGGSINSIVDRNGNTISFAYTNGNLTTITDPAARTTALTYDANNHLTSITDPTGSSYSFGFSGNTLTSVTYPDGGQWRYTYDANDFMLSKADPLSNTTTYTYDAKHRVASATDPEGKTRSVAYAQPGTDVAKTTTFTEKDGGVWTYRYDTQAGTLTSKTDPQGGATSYTYDASGNRTSTTLPDSTTSTSTYDGQGNMTATTDALGQTTSYTYNGFGQVLTIKDPQGNITGYTYDANGNLSTMTDPTGATTQYQYDARGNIAKITNPLGQSTSFVYDAKGNLVSVTDPAGATTSYTYDAAGNRTSQTDDAGNTTSFTYDAGNRLVKVTDPQGNVTAYTYDLSGNKTSQTDANGNTTKYSYNYKGQLVNTTDPLGNATNYAYGATGCPSCGGGTDKLTSLTDANGNGTIYQYDTLGRLLNETDPLGNVTSYTYDANGKLSAKTDANGATIKYTYDSLGRLLKKTYPDATATAFTYDAKGNILTAANQNISYTFTYDAKGAPLSVSDSNGRTISYTYDANGNKTKTVSPDGRTISYSYDTAGRLTGILDGGTFTIGYDNLGRRSSLAYPNGDTTTYGYDKDGNLVSLVQKNAKGIVIASNSYTLDKIGNRLGNTTPDRSIAYQYDAIYRLTQALSSTPGYSSNNTGKGGGIPNATQQQKEFYTYDPVGNRLSSDKTQTYVYNQGNQLVVNGGNYTYDKNGNLIQKVSPDGTTTYVWDYENRLIKVTMPDGTVVEFAYDPFGKRIAKKVTESDAATTTRYFYDNDNILFEYDESGAIGNRYTHGPGVDEHLMVNTGKDKYFYHADGLGSIIALTDSAGNVVQTYEYDSFGNLKDQKNRVKQPFAYTGREWDKETGLYYYRARDYDPMEGRFISKDPIGVQGGTNLYSYVSNNPVNFTDPTGLVKWSGSLTGAAGVDGIGAGFFRFDLTSECINNHRVRIKGYASTVAVGAGIKWTGTTSQVSFHDNYSTPNPNAANGFAGVISIGAAAGGEGAGGLGYAYSSVKLGSLISDWGGGKQTGLDFSAGVYLGSSVVTSSQVLDCCGQ